MGSFVKVIQFGTAPFQGVAPFPCSPNTIQANPCQSGSDPNVTKPHRSRVNVAKPAMQEVINGTVARPRRKTAFKVKHSE